MNTLATLSINEAYVPLTPESRAMLITSLTDILTRYETWDRGSAKIVTHYIHAPQLRTAHPIHSADCGPESVGCAG